MKSRLQVFLIMLSAFICFGKHINAQESTHRPWPQFAIVGQHPLMLGYIKNSYTHFLSNISSYQFGLETTWQPRKNGNTHYSLNLLYGTYYLKHLNKTDLEPTAELGISTFFGSGNHFFELGLGTDLSGLSKVIIGYRTYLWKKLLLKVQFLPTSFFWAGYEDDISYWDFGFGIGYRFNDKTSGHVVNGIGFLYRHSYLGLEAMPAPIDKYDDFPAPLVWVNYGFAPFRKGKFQLLLSAGVGSLIEGSMAQTGISIIYGQNRHFLETGVNFIFTLLRNPNFEYAEYVLPQFQVGYRYTFAKDRLFARIAYAPYIRMLDWKREGGLQQNMVLGLGFHLAK